jgi:hypothetical protein
MARLYDRINNGTLMFTKKLNSHTDGMFQRLREFMPTAPVIVIDNVTRYWIDNYPLDDVPRPQDFAPNVMPPFSAFWLDARTRGAVDRMPAQFGALVIATEPRDTDGCCLDMLLFTGPTAGNPYPFVEGEVLVQVNRTGQVEGDWLHSTPARSDDPNDQLFPLVYPLLLAISFMHCKNVAQRTEEQPLKLSKKWQKKHGRPLVRYHVLDIDPMRKVLRTEGGLNEHGSIPKALHICRGHFATYTEDAPLFGRVTGTFWKPQHVRGSAKAGAVIKDYNVKEPRR